MPNKKFIIRPAQLRPQRFMRLKSASVEARSQTTFDGPSRASTHLLNPHKTIHLNDTARAAARPRPALIDLVHPAPNASDLEGLYRAYAAFFALVDEVKEDYPSVPAEGDARETFLDGLVTGAWFCLAREVRAFTAPRIAAIGRFVPDLLFARFDHRSPAAFAAGIAPQTRAEWIGVHRLLTDRWAKLVISMSEAQALVHGRMMAEAHLHRPITGLFSEVTDAR